MAGPLGRDFDASRFRPNFVIETADGAPGFVENDRVGGELAIGGEPRGGRPSWTSWGRMPDLDA